MGNYYDLKILKLLDDVDGVFESSVYDSAGLRGIINVIGEYKAIKAKVMNSVIDPSFDPGTFDEVERAVFEHLVKRI